MNFFYRLTLHKKITTIIVSTVLFVLSLGFGISFYQELVTLKERLLAENILTAKIVASYTVSDLTFNNKESARQSLSYLKTEPTILNAHLYDEQDNHFVSLYNQQTVKEHYKYTGASHEFSNKILNVTEPVMLEGKKIGVLHLVTSTDNYFKIIESRIYFFIILLVSLIILSILIAGRLSGIITSPILTLVKAAKSISRNSTYNVKVETRYKDEVGQLIKAFNEMQIQIKKRETERDEAESLLKNSEVHLKLILNNMVEGVMTIDKDGKIVSMNKTAEKIFGYSEKDAIGQPVKMLITQQQIKKYSEHIQLFKTTDELGFIAKGLETVGRKKNDKEFPIYVSIVEIPEKNKHERCFVISCEDITCKKTQDEQLRRTQRMDALGKLTGGIAHDYNNMLGVILGYAELIEIDSADNENIMPYVTEIIRAGDRGKILTRKLLAFTKRESTESESVNVNLLLNENQNMIAKTLTSRIKLDLVLEKNTWNVWLDKSDLEDAIINLSINAMHAMEGGGSLTIKTENIFLDEIEAQNLQLQKGDHVKLRVLDTGEGMEEATRVHIFEPFFTTKQDKGTGLGLSQVYGFVKRSRGAVKVYSEPGAGTYFDFYFPRYVTSSEITGDIEVDNKNLDSLKGKETILVVDDEPGLRKLAVELLGRYGYNVISAESGKQALTILESTKIDLLLTDIIMPEIDGYELSETVARLYPDIKIQLASGFSDNKGINETSKNLQTALLQKPYRIEVLLKSVRNLLDAKYKH